MSLVARKSQQWFDALIAQYGRLLNWVLDHQPLTLLVAVGTLGLTVFLYIVIPKGFFPVQDTGLIQGISEAAPSVSFEAMAQRQQALAAAILKDPDVVSLSSFIGVDGTNTTLNSGRFLINLKPRDATKHLGQRRDPATGAGDARCRRDLALHAAGAGSDHRRDGQPLAISIRAGGRQPERVLDLGSEIARSVCSNCRRSRMSPAITRENGLSAYIQIDRPTAARFGITPATVDNALYDLFGQRIVSTIFTQSNQYRVILEADPDLQQSLSSLGQIYLPSSTATNGQVPLSAIAQVEEQTAPLRDQPSRPISVDYRVVQSGTRRIARRGGRCDQASRAGNRHARQHDHRLPGRGAGVSGRARQRARADHRGDHHDVYRAGCALRELHPPDHDPLDTCLRPVSERCWR